MTESETLKLGIDAAKAGNLEKAQSYFAQTVQNNPNSELGWLYLGYCINDNEKKKICYQKVLAINPENERATQALASLAHPELTEKKNDQLKQQTTQLPVEQKQRTHAKKRNNIPSIYSTMGIIIGGILCAGMFLGVAYFSGLLTGGVIKSQPSIITAQNTQVPENIPIVSTVTKIPSSTPHPTSTFANTATPLPGVSSDDPAMADFYNNTSITYWTQIIAGDPQNADAYYQRASAAYKIIKAVGSLGTYRSKLEFILHDIDTAIALRPDVGDYYSLRGSVYVSLSSTTEYNVDTEYLAALSLDNAYKAYELGTSAEYPDRSIVVDLIYSNQCEKALELSQQIIDKLPQGDTTLGGALNIRSQALACLGRLDEALKSINASMFNNENMDIKTTMKIQYLVLLGRYSEALPLLDKRICDCELSGWQYYLRAYIYYETGKRDLAQQDLYEGMPRTWGRGGMLTYVEALMALDDGRKDDAIQLLQIAEATLNPTFNHLRWDIQKQLAELGSKSLELTRIAPYEATPIPH
ncbi:MAG: hypothetical protein IPP66_14955 [Anaerolineales bacterium]|nr:hypothetical protein [Anaerolineales bacterium]